jgi:hypothetical protein
MAKKLCTMAIALSALVKFEPCIWDHQKVLLKSFPMNGHISRFQQSQILFGNFYIPALVREVTISP